MDTIGAVVLAAGKGTRMGCTDIPKVMIELGGRPMVSYIVDTLESMGLGPEQIVLVVGFQKEKVKAYFGDRVTYAHQVEQQGTAHAAYVGMQALSDTCTDVLVLGGDDSAFYTKSSLESFVEAHVSQGMKLSLLSTEVVDPSQLGRVVRYPHGDIEVIEKEYVTPVQARINEISTGTFCFDRAWYIDMYPSMPPLRKLGEYGLPTALAMVREAALPYQVVKLENSAEWFGINTPEQHKEAERRKSI